MKSLRLSLVFIIRHLFSLRPTDSTPSIVRGFMIFSVMFRVGKNRDYHLCDELIFEIFTRLPPKSLIRFRSLSKIWYSSISSPDFICMHKVRSQQKLLIRHRTLNENEEDEYDGFYTLHPQDQLPLRRTRGYIGTTPVEFPSTYSTIVGSCNGIVCLFDYKENSISLWNPSIRRKLTLPDCPRKCYSLVEIGFGFDPVSDDYKIVSVPGFNTTSTENEESSFVYTMKTDTWCAIPSPLPKFARVVTKVCFVNGALYWLVQCGPKDTHLLTFNLSTHVFGTIAVPGNYSHTLAPTTIQGSLAVVSTNCSREDNWIWVRRDASWSLVSKFKDDQLEGQLLHGVLQLSTNGDLVFDTHGRGFQVCDPKTGMCSELKAFNAAFFVLEIVECLESLQLLDMGTAC